MLRQAGRGVLRLKNAGLNEPLLFQEDGPRAPRLPYCSSVKQSLFQSYLSCDSFPEPRERVQDSNPYARNQKGTFIGFLVFSLFPTLTIDRPQSISGSGMPPVGKCLQIHSKGFVVCIFWLTVTGDASNNFRKRHSSCIRLLKICGRAAGELSILIRIKNCTKIENADACTSEILIETECKMRS